MKNYRNFKTLSFVTIDTIVGNVLIYIKQVAMIANDGLDVYIGTNIKITYKEKVEIAYLIFLIVFCLSKNKFTEFILLS